MLRCGRGWISLSTVVVTGMSNKIWMLTQLARHDLHGSNSLAFALALALKLNGLYTYLVTDTMACPLIDNGSLYRAINVSKPKDFWV